MKRRLLSLLLALALIMTLMPVGAWADTTVLASGECGADGDNVTWVLTSDWTLTISGNGDMADYSGASTSVPWYSNRNNIKSVIIEDGVTSIASCSFDGYYGYQSLTSVYIAQSVKSIGDRAFYFCRSLVDVNMPDSITSIGEDAFYNCVKMVYINMPDDMISIGKRAFMGCTQLTGLEITDKIASIGGHAFDGCNLGDVEIPESLTDIGEYAFYRCNLTSLTIPDSVNSIGAYAFSNTSLKSVTIPDGVTSIGEYAFSESDLTSVNIGSVENLGSGIFSECRSLSRVDISGIIPRIPSHMFEYTKVNNITIPGSVTGIYENAFFSCKSLTNLNILNGVKYINSNSFYGCDGLTSVNIPASVVSMSNPFTNCKNLVSVNVSENNSKYYSIDGVLYDGEANMLDLCPEGRKDIFFIIPDGIEKIGSIACRNLTAVSIPDSVTYIAYYAFANSSLTDVYYWGTESQWSEIDIKDYAGLDNAVIHYDSLKDDISASVDYETLNDSIAINGRGKAYLRYKMLDLSGNILQGKHFKCEFAGYDTVAEAVSDENGMVTFETPELTETTELQLSISAVDGTAVLGHSHTENITVKELSYSQTWTGQRAVKGMIEAALGVGADATVVEAEAKLASASVNGELGSSFSLTETYDDGRRELELTNTISGELGGKIKAGLWGKGDILNGKIEIDAGSVNVGASYGHDNSRTLKLKDYDPSDIGQLAQISYFLASAAHTADSNVIYEVLLELLGLSGDVEAFNESSSLHTLTAEAGADLGNIEVAGEDVGTLFTIGGRTIWQSSDGINIDGNNEYSSRLITSADYSLGDLSLKTRLKDLEIGAIEKAESGSNFDILSGDFWDNNVEVNAESNDSGIQSLELNVTRKEDGGGFLLREWSQSSESSFKYSGEQAAIAAENNNLLSNLAEGSEGFVSPLRMVTAIDSLIDSAVHGVYENSEKHNIVTEFSLDLGLTAVAGFEVGLRLAGIEDYEFVEKNGIIYGDQRYIQAVSDVGEDVEAARKSLDEIIAEPVKVISDIVAENIQEFWGSAKEGVQNLGAAVEGAAEWFVVKITSFRDSDAASYSILSVADELSLFESSSVATTVGMPYIISVTDAESGAEITDFSSSPLKLTLSYDESDLAAAEISGAAEELEKMKIHRYDETKGVYVCMGGTHSTTDSAISLDITRSGQYILAVDNVPPSITEFMVSDNTTMPVIKATVADMSGIEDFSLEIDGVEMVDSSSFGEYYNEANSVFEYTVTEPLSAGEHTAVIEASDSAGNVMANAMTLTFTVDDTMPVIESFYAGEDAEGVLQISAVARDNNLNNVKAYVEESGKIFTYELSAPDVDGGAWTTSIDVPVGYIADVWVVAYDDAGNSSTSETITTGNCLYIVNGIEESQGGGLSVSVISSTEKEAQLILAAYDADDKLIRNDIETVSGILPGETGVVDCDIDYSDAAYLYVFVCDAADEMRPVSRKIKIDL